MKKVTLVLILITSLSTYCSAQNSFAGLSFDTLSVGMPQNNAYVLALAFKDSILHSPLYAGGYFTIAGRDSILNIAEWNDSTGYNYGKWEPLGAGVNGVVYSLAMYGERLYAGGKFDTAGGIASSHIACWDTAALKWDSLSGNLNGNVYALCVYNNALYVGGDFTIADGDTVNRIAMWNGSAWSAVGKGFDSTVYALIVYNDTLYAGGAFIKSNGNVINHIAKWKGAKWDSLESGTNNTVYALGKQTPMYGGGLFVGGAFTKAGKLHNNYIATYDYYYIDDWDTGLSPGVNDTVRAINAGNGIMGLVIRPGTHQTTWAGNLILIGGNFTKAGGYNSHYIAGLMGQWDTVGQLNGPVFAIANPYPNYYDGGGDNYVGGEFNLTQQHLATNHVAYINIFLGGGIPSLYNNSNISIYPNPSNGIFTLAFSHPELVSGSQTKIEVYNVLGEPIYNETLKQVQSDNMIDLSNQPNGIYLYRVVDENSNLIGQGKLIIQK